MTRIAYRTIRKTTYAITMAISTPTISAKTPPVVRMRKVYRPPKRPAHSAQRLIVHLSSCWPRGQRLAAAARQQHWPRRLRRGTSRLRRVLLRRPHRIRHARPAAAVLTHVHVAHSLASDRLTPPDNPPAPNRRGQLLVGKRPEARSSSRLVLKTASRASLGIERHSELPRLRGVSSSQSIVAAAMRTCESTMADGQDGG